MTRPDCGCGPQVPRRRFLQLGTGTALGAALFGVSAGRAAAAPSTPRFGKLIDPYAEYVGQTTCHSTARPGVVDFKNMLLAAYPRTQDWGIVRSCSAGGTSEHKEGRAFDWGITGDRAAVDDLVRWLLATDRWGNRHARARRLGIMYFIHNKKIWRAYSPGPGFAKRACDPNASFDDCHFDHIHFSFSWRGADMQTSWWNPESTFTRTTNAYWQAGAAGEAEGPGVPPPGTLECC